MAYAENENRLSIGTPGAIAIMGAGVALILGIALVATENATGDVVGPGPDTDVQEAPLATTTDAGDASNATQPMGAGNGASDTVAGATVMPVNEPAAAAPDENASTPNTANMGTDLDTGLVVDPNDGSPNDPDGGAAPFYPTPSGPEGRDGSSLTVE